MVTTHKTVSTKNWNRVAAIQDAMKNRQKIQAFLLFYIVWNNGTAFPCFRGLLYYCFVSALYSTSSRNAGFSLV